MYFHISVHFLWMQVFGCFFSTLYQSNTTKLHPSNTDLELLRIWLYVLASFFIRSIRLEWSAGKSVHLWWGQFHSCSPGWKLWGFFWWHTLSKKLKLGIPQLVFLKEATMAHLIVKRWNAGIFDVLSLHFAPCIRFFLTMSIMLHYDLAMLKSAACIQTNSVSLSCEASYWTIWNYVLQIYCLARDSCKKCGKIIMCLKLLLFRVLLFGDFCVYFPKGVNLLHIFLNKSSCSANVSL